VKALGVFSFFLVGSLFERILSEPEVLGVKRSLDYSLQETTATSGACAWSAGLESWPSYRGKTLSQNRGELHTVETGQSHSGVEISSYMGHLVGKLATRAPGEGRSGGK
jgi:hypothetical protein